MNLNTRGNESNGKCLELSIVIPCLNERESLGICITKALTWLKNNDVDGEVLVSDNGSIDGSQEIASSFGVRLVEVAHRGYGNAIMSGIKAAKGNYIIVGDADDSYDFSQLNSFLEKLRAGDDLVMGCRFPSGGGRIMPGAMPLLHRWVGNPTLSLIGRLFFRTKITDFHCGLRGFHRDSILKLNLETTGMEFASEMVVKACLKNLKVSETPVTLYPDKRNRPPHLKTWRDGWRHLRFLLLFAPDWLFLFPALAIILAGVVPFGLTMNGPYEISGVILDTNSLLVGCLFLITGFQIASFWLAARIFSYEQGFLSKPKYYRSILKFLNLELGLIVGSFFLLIGATLIFSVFRLWIATDFGQLDYLSHNRRIIIGVFNAILGMQIVFLSFFLSILAIKR